MTSHFRYFICFFLSSGLLFAQKTEKVVVAKKDPHSLYMYADGDSTQLFYLQYVPKSAPKGVLVLLPGAGENVLDISKQIALPQLAVAQNWLVIIPSRNWGTLKSEVDIQFLDTLFKKVSTEHAVPKDRWILGGFSAGAMLALRYTEKANSHPHATYLVPKAVFGVDPPLDHTHLWQQCERDVARNFSPPAVQEGKMVMKSYLEEFGGTPTTVPEEYIKYSIYSRTEKDGGNAKFLYKTPLRLYSEPGIAWQLKNRHRDLYDLNCTDISSLINLLQQQGNDKAEMIITHDKGKRLNGQYHPHSWSILDAADCLKWMENI